MSINDELRRGVERAIRDIGQPANLSSRLVAWLNEMSQRELSKQEHSRHLLNVRNAVDVAGIGGSDED